MADLALLEKLCRSFGPSGNEDRVRSIIINEIKPYCTKLRIDRTGNLIAFKKGAAVPANKLLFAAHMDEVALMVTGFTESGCLTFDEVGGIDERILPAKRVRIGKLPGVIASKPIHCMTKNERTKPMKINDLVIDIGARDREDAKKYVKVGDYVAFEPNFTRFGTNSVLSKALDDRIGCLLLTELLKKQLAYDITVVFTVQEECGLRGAATAAFAEQPDIAVAVDSTTACDIEGIQGANVICEQKAGAVISYIDKATVYPRELIEVLTKAADREKLPYQFKRLATGGNDSASLQRSAKGARVLSMSAPVRYIHSPASTANTADIESMEKLLLLAVNEFGALPKERQ